MARGCLGVLVIIARDTRQEREDCDRQESGRTRYRIVDSRGNARVFRWDRSEHSRGEWGDHQCQPQADDGYPRKDVDNVSGTRSDPQ
jgi:hypothetical protein